MASANKRQENKARPLGQAISLDLAATEEAFGRGDYLRARLLGAALLGQTPPHASQLAAGLPVAVAEALARRAQNLASWHFAARLGLVSFVAYGLAWLWALGWGRT